MILMSPIHNSCSANLLPTHIRGPKPNGSTMNGSTFSSLAPRRLSVRIHLSGRKTSGSEKYLVEGETVSAAKYEEWEAAEAAGAERPSFRSTTKRNFPRSVDPVKGGKMPSFPSSIFASDEFHERDSTTKPDSFSDFFPSLDFTLERG